MTINHYYKFKHCPGTENLYYLQSRSGSYNLLDTNEEVSLNRRIAVNESSSLLELNLPGRRMINVTFPTTKKGFGFVKNNEDLLLFRYSLNRMILHIYVLEGMKPFTQMIFQMFLDGSLRKDLKAIQESSELQ